MLIPRVDMVRKVVRANMADVSDAMKKWRNLQKVQPVAPVLINVPQAIDEANRAMLGALWQSAMELSNSTLRSAQAGWEAERLETAVMGKEMADGYEAKLSEVALAQSEITQLQANVAGNPSGFLLRRGCQHGLICKERVAEHEP